MNIYFGYSGSLEELKEYNLVEDCEKFKGVYEHSLWILASTLAACEQLMQKQAQIAINWSVFGAFLVIQRTT